MDIHEIRKINLISLIGSRRKGACAEKWEMSAAHLSQVLSDKTPKNLGEDVARRIERLEGLPHGWMDTLQSLGSEGSAPREQSVALTTGTSKTSTAALVLDMLKGKNLRPDQLSRIEQAVSDTIDDKPAAPADNVITADFSRRPVVGDEIRIAHYDVQGAMGGGKVVHDFPEMFRDVTVSQQHLRELGVTYKDPAHLKLITGAGQSMEPTIKDKDPLIADASIREFVGDGIYALSWHGHFYIKRLQVADAEHFEMISDNPKHKDRIVRIDETYIQAKILLVWNATRV